MFQQFMAVGNLGNEPEMRFTPGGTPVTTFSLAINKTWTNIDGQKQDKARPRVEVEISQVDKVRSG